METFQTVLNQITTKEPNELTPFDIAFMKARASYLTPYQLDKYQSVLNQAAPTQKIEPTEAVTPTMPGSYHELKAKAKSLGLVNTKVSRTALEKYIVEHS